MAKSDHTPPPREDGEPDSLIAYGRPASSDPSSATLSMDAASRLLRLGLSGRRRPVDDLIDRLNEDDSATWLPRSLDAGPLLGIGTAQEILVDGNADLMKLAAIKERSKAMLERPQDRNERLAGLAGYFLAIAAGLCHHGKVIGGRGAEERNAVFLDLAAAAPEPYCTMLSKATMVPGC